MNDKNMPVVSVVMSVHNGERYLKQAINSILNQTFTDFEFIIIDDGSTDKSGKILDKLAKQDKRIRLFSQENSGLTRSLNAGIRMAQGQYIARMDADDVSVPDRLARQVAFLETNPNCVAVGSEVLLTDPEDWPIGPRRHRYVHDEIEARLLLGDGGAMTHPAVMLRTSAVRAIGGYREEFVTTQDLDLFLRLSEVGTLSNLPESLLRWRQHPDSVNHTRSQTWKEMKYKALSDAVRRRDIALNVEEIVAVQPVIRDDLRFYWAETAYRTGFFPSAIKNWIYSILQQGPKEYHRKFAQKLISETIRHNLRRVRAFAHKLVHLS